MTAYVENSAHKLSKHHSRNRPADWIGKRELIHRFAKIAVAVVALLAFSNNQSATAQTKQGKDGQAAEDDTKRTWTDSTGKFKVVASFITLKDGIIHLKKTSNGTVLKLPLERLCGADQQVAKQLDAARLQAMSRPKTSDYIPPKLSAKLRWSDLFDVDENNKPTPTYLELLVTATGTDARVALEFGHLHLDTIVDGSGTNLKLRTPENEFFDLSKKFVKVRDRGTGFFAKHPEDGVRCVFQLVRPNASVKKVQSVKGSFKLKIGTGQNKVKIEKATASLGKVQSKVLAGMGIKAEIIRSNADLLEIRVENSNSKNHIQVKVLDPNQEKLLDLNGVSERGTRIARTFSFSFKRSVPANATVFIAVASNTLEKTIPFSFEDLELPNKK